MRDKATEPKQLVTYHKPRNPYLRIDYEFPPGTTDQQKTEFAHKIAEAVLVIQVGQGDRHD